MKNNGCIIKDLPCSSSKPQQHSGQEEVRGKIPTVRTLYRDLDISGRAKAAGQKHYLPREQLKKERYEATQAEGSSHQHQSGH